MVISIIVANFEMYKIMIDSGSLINILFYDAFTRMKLIIDRLKPMLSFLYGFHREANVPKGVITLSMTLGTYSHHLDFMTDFMVVKIPSTYNMILDRPFLRMAKAMLSTHYLVMNFPTKDKIGEVRGNQIIAHEYYLAIVKGKEKAKEIFIVSLDNIAK